jgi:Membrane-associated phospholipid phosphatase
MRLILLLTVCILFFYKMSFSQNTDFRWIRSLNQIDETRGFSKVISHSTTEVAFVAPVALSVVALIQNDDEMLKDGIYILASNIIITGFVTQSIKSIANRQRPFAAYPDDITQYDFTVGRGRSFPSGHTSLAFASATALSLKYPQWYIVVPSYFWACSVGYSRMNLGVHYPSDVAVGAVIGAGSAYLTYLFNEWFWEKAGNKRILSDKKAKAEVWY